MRDTKWRSRQALVLLSVWGAVSLANLSRLAEPPPAAPGEVIVPALPFFRAEMPADAAFLYVLPDDSGSGRGIGLRLRYELFPRTYENVRVSDDEACVRALMHSRHIRIVVVPGASVYPSTAWLRQERDWFHRIQYDAADYLLEAEP